MKESENPNLGGKIFRYDGDGKWADCGQLPETESIGGFAVFRGKLHAGSLYKPAGFFRYEGDQKLTTLPVPNGKRRPPRRARRRWRRRLSGRPYGPPSRLTFWAMS